MTDHVHLAGCRHLEQGQVRVICESCAQHRALSSVTAKLRKSSHQAKATSSLGHWWADPESCPKDMTTYIILTQGGVAPLTATPQLWARAPGCGKPPLPGACSQGPQLLP